MHRRLWRWLRWTVTGIAVLLLAIGIAGWYYTQTDQFRDTLRSRLLAALNDSLNAEVDFKEVTGSIWSTLSFRDVALIQQGVPVLSAQSISIRLGILGQILPLLTNATVHIGEIEIEKPQLWLAQDRDKRWNVLTLLKPREAEEPGRFRIYLDEIKISDGKVEAATADGKQARITSLTLKGDAALLPTGIGIDFDYLNFALASPGMPSVTWGSAFSLKDSGKTSELEIQRLDLATNKSQLRIAGTVRDLKEPTVAITLELARGAAEEITEMFPAVPLRQDISARLKASGPLSKLQVSGALKALDGQVDTSVVADLISERSVRGKLEIKGFAVDKVLKISGFSGRADGQINFAGSSLEDAEAAAKASLTRAVVNEWELGDVTLSGGLKNKNVSVAAHAEAKGGKADLKGTVALLETPAYELTLNARALDLKKAAGDKAPISAKINLDAWAKGRGTEPKGMEVDTKITFHPSQVGAIQVQQGFVEGGLRGGALIVREARLVAEGTTFNAKGKVASLKKDAAGTITYSLRSKDIRPWAQLVGVEATGSANLDGTVAGSLQSPRLEGKAFLNELGLAKARVENGTVRWVATKDARNQWRGQFKIAAKQLVAGVPLQSLDAEVALEGLDPATVAAEITARDADQHVHRVKTRLIHSGERTDVLLQEIALQFDGAWRNPRPARIVVEGKKVTLEDFSLQYGTQGVTAKGVTGWQGTQNLFVQVNRFPIERLRAYLKDAPAVGGILSLTVQIHGTAAQPIIDGSLNAESLTVAGQPYAALTGQAKYQTERLSMDLRLAQDQNHDLTAKGVLPVYLGWGDNRSPAVKGDADLRIYSEGLNPTFLSLLTKDVDSLQGSLKLDVQLRGPFNALTPRGTIQFQNGGARVVPLNLALKEIDLHANVTPGTIELTRLNARSGDGQLTGTGRLGLKQYSITAIGMTLNADQFQVINTREYKALASGKLAASGTLQQPMIRGDLTVKGTLRPDMALMKRTGRASEDSTIVVVRSESDLVGQDERAMSGTNSQNGAGNTQKQSPLFDQLGLEITAQISRGTWLYLDEGSMELTGDLRVKKGPKESMAVVGKLQGVRGWYSFKGKRFRLEKAEVTLTGGTQIDPIIDIVGLYRVPQYQIYANIGGTSSKPTLTLRSEPQLEQADILAVLLFGKPVNTLSQGEQKTLQNEALKATAAYIASDLKQSVASSLGLDIVEVGAGDTLSQTQVEVGKYVRDDVFVSATQQFGGEQEQEYAIEYNVTPNVQIKSSTTSQGKSGIDIFWKKQY
jgi:autotransporter translocation and assembly factor TamB